MKIYREMPLRNFEAWSGGEETLSRLYEHDCLDLFEAIIEELYPEGIDETYLNDLLRFDADWVFGIVGLRSESEVERELRDAKDELADLLNDIEESGEDEESQARQLELEEKIAELKEELRTF